MPTDHDFELLPTVQYPDRPYAFGAPLRNVKANVHPFAGQMGANQANILDADQPENAAFLHKTPDASPLLSLADILSPRPFSDLELWRNALAEFLRTMILVVVTAWPTLHPAITTAEIVDGAKNLGAGGVYATATFLGPLAGGFVNWITLAMLIYTFSSVSGAHLNPTITLGTFFARLITLPRMILYIFAQAVGGALGGLILSSAYGSRDFQAGGCTIDTTLVPVPDAFSIEYIYCLALILLAFGVGLDPRQSSVISPTLAPWLVGLVLMLLSFSSAFTRPGYFGACMNPARCFGVYVGSSFPGYHWIHWVGPAVAGISHGLGYFLVPPWRTVTGAAVR